VHPLRRESHLHDRRPETRHSTAFDAIRLRDQPPQRNNGDRCPHGPGRQIHHATLTRRSEDQADHPFDGPIHVRGQARRRRSASGPRLTCCSARLPRPLSTSGRKRPTGQSCDKRLRNFGRRPNKLVFLGANAHSSVHVNQDAEGVSQAAIASGAARSYPCSRPVFFRCSWNSWASR
jgi:hypothetical protein